MADGLHTLDAKTERCAVRVRGAVQGVGFRPFVWSLAHELGLVGWVRNDSEGVLAEIEGSTTKISQFLECLETKAPPLARIDSVTSDALNPAGDTSFDIVQSEAGRAARTSITPDVATCDACLEDIFDPGNRRHLYAFTNCTHCGPRYTITRQLPYDRAETSMASFKMCPDCQSEYEDPADRRFHAQPNACPSCGPQLSMSPAEMVARLQAGEILAIKGLGGFHLVADATNANAVATLRRRKQRDGKPFAVMVAGLTSAQSLAEISDIEAELLTDRKRPIVLANAHPDNGIAMEVTNGLKTIGIMLPYAPVHHLLFHAAAGAPEGTDFLEQDNPLRLVMTSANPGGEPLVTGNQEAHERLGDIADAVVTHDRDIVVRCDDSVVRVIDGAPTYLRRARGYTPDPIPLPHEVPCTLALGGHLKNTVCLTRGNEAFVSQHIGDLDNPSTLDFLRETVSHLMSILDVSPERVACDLHPDFLSSKLARSFGVPCIEVQHHHAHIAAVAAEHGLTCQYLGLAMDGFGLGEDGASSWGGEFLAVSGQEFTRFGHLATLKQPGGDIAARQPWRMGAAALHALGRNKHITDTYGRFEGADLVATMLAKDINAPLTSSCGRLFDAACGLLGIKPVASFEGDAPMALESLVTKPCVFEGGWSISDAGVLDFTGLLTALLDRDAQSGANLFHGTLAAGLAEACSHWIAAGDLPQTVLAGGGCFQNRVLSETLSENLSQRGINLLLPQRIPANDGGLSLGQAWIAANTDLTKEG